MIEFKNTLVLLLLPILGIGIFYVFFFRKKMSGILFPTVSMYLKGYFQKKVLLRKAVLSIMYFLMFAMLIIAIARPRIPNMITILPEEGVDIVLALDISGSMQAIEQSEKNENYESRLDVVKKVITKFINKRKSDRIGLVLFAGESFTQCPLTVDYDILKFLIKKADVGMLKDGTAIGMAIATAVKRLVNVKGKSKIIILLTDGKNNTGTISPLAAAELAKKYGIKIYTIGVGSNNWVYFPVRTNYGTIGLQKTIIEADKELLKKIAEITNGKFFDAKSVKALDEIYNTIDKLEKTKKKVKRYVEYKELFVLFLKYSVILLMFAVILEHTVFLRVP